MSHQAVVAALNQAHGGCHSDEDGDCDWSQCPQSRDGEPEKTGRFCPLWIDLEEE